MREFTAAALAVLALPGLALAADSWGLDNETELMTSGKVVDVLCELNGDCPQDCGGGERQLGLVEEGSGRLLLAAKSSTLFAAPVLDLLPHCGQTVETDGLMIEHPAMNLYFVQYLRLPGEEEFASTDAYGEAFRAQNGDAAWPQEHPDALALVEERGKLGDPGLTLDE